jgi:cytochrome c oxidase subunit II
MIDHFFSSRFRFQRSVPGAALAGALTLAAVSSPAIATQATEPRTIQVVTKRFAFEPAVIEVVEGEKVVLLVSSADGPHGFAIAKLRIDKEVPRGPEVVKIELTPKEVGEFPILCSVLCGEGHLEMKGTLTVVARKGAPQ